MLKVQKPEPQTVTCPVCGLNLQTETGVNSVTVNYDVRVWQRHCESLRVGTPFLCPELRPQLQDLLGPGGGRRQ
jgi:hypothetical protein